MADENDDGVVQDPSSDDDGVELCDATSDQCDLDVREMDEGGPEATPREELQDGFPLTEIRQVTSPVDGLPIPADERYVPDAAPPFTRDHQVCVEDDRTYVELFRDELESRGWVFRECEILDANDPRWGMGSWLPPGVAPLGREYPAIELFLAVERSWQLDGQPTKRREWPKSEVHFGYGQAFVRVTDKNSKIWLIPVRPKRERCKFYKRQDYANSAQPDPTEHGHHIIARNCLARRSIGGAALSVSNEAVYACDYRDPPDPATTEYFLDGPDRKHLDSNAHKKKVPLFGAS